jgi:hypothetical protein
MTIAPGTYFAKDRYTGEYQLVRDGEVVGVVKTRKEATKWWDREQRVEKPCDASARAARQDQFEAAVAANNRCFRAEHSNKLVRAGTRNGNPFL